MAADLPKEFDVIVLGTGMPESIVAAAFSRIGQTVLHLDRNDYYSGDWASFSLKAIETWAQKHAVGVDTTVNPGGWFTRPEDEGGFLEEDETLVQLPLYNSSFSQADMQFHVSDIDDKVTNTTEVAVTESLENLHLVETENNKTCDATNSETEHTNTEDGSNSEAETGAISDNVCTNIVSKQDPTATYMVDESSAVSIAECSEGSEMTGNSDKTGEAKVVKDDSVVCDTHNVEEDNHDEKTETEGNINTSVSQCGGGDNGEVVESGEAIHTDPDVKEEKTEEKWTVSKLRDKWRNFNLDVSPKVLFSGGDMVELLISSDIAKYCEFKTVTRILTILNGKLEKVPCSRADVFSSKNVSMLEKRMLMKFLKFSMDYEEKLEEIQDYLERPFTDFLTSQKMTPNIKHFIQHSIAFAIDSTSTKQGLEESQKFLRSLGRYGNTAFLWSLYGSGELPQSFCRMCAVFGGLYCLRMSASSLILDNNNTCKGVVTTEGQRIGCKWLIMEHSYAPASFLSTNGYRCISRCILLADKPLLPTDSQELSLMCLPCPDDGDRPILLLELPPQSMSAPAGVYVYHLTRAGRPEDVTPQQDLSYAVDKLFCSNGETSAGTQPEAPHVLWSLYFSQVDGSHVTGSGTLPLNVVIMPGSGPEFHCDTPVLEARKVFKKILPDEEFLPKAPNPEDIIYVDDTEAQVNEGSSQAEFNGSETEIKMDEEPQSEMDQSQTEAKLDGDNGQFICECSATDQSECDSGQSESQTSQAEQSTSDTAGTKAVSSETEENKDDH